MNESNQPLIEERLIEADLARLRRQQDDPHQERRAWQLMQLESQRRQQHSGARL